MKYKRYIVVVASLGLLLLGASCQKASTKTTNATGVSQPVPPPPPEPYMPSNY